MNGSLVLLLVLFVAYALFSRRLGRSSVTGPMLFMAAGLVAAWIVVGGGSAAEVLQLELSNETIQVLLEATLVIVLFSDAVLIDYRAVRSEATIPTRLLGIGLPLTIIAGIAAAMLLFPGLGFWPAAIIAIILAPTDAALGQAVLANRSVPAAVRQGLSVESGLNDGIAVPFLAIAVAGAADELQTGSEIATLFLEEIGLAIVVGIIVGRCGSWLLSECMSRGWMGGEGRRVLVVVLALLSYALADPIGGSGFIAAFVGGLTFGRFTRSAYPDITRFSEAVSHLLTMTSFFVFGALILGPVLGEVDWRVVAYAVASLTVVRMVPVAISLIGTRSDVRTQLYIGWFGPRGLASLVFVGTVVLESGLPFTEEVILVVAVTVGCSVLAHGISAWPLSNRYGRWFAAMADDDMVGMAEALEVEHMPRRGVTRQMHAPMGDGGEANGEVGDARSVRDG